MRSKKASLLRGLLFLLVLLFALGGCGSTGGMDRGDGDDGGDGDGGPAPTPEVVGGITLSASRDSILADGVSQTVITAQVQNEDGLLMSRPVTVNFSATGGALAPTSVTTENGVASVTLTSSTQEGNVTVSASAEGVTPEAPLDIIFTAVPAEFAISATQNTVSSDNSNSATVTVTILDSQRVPILGVPVNFIVNGGQISASTVVSNEQGQAQVVFRAGDVNRTNRTVTITAEVPGIGSKSIPIQIVGSEIALTTNQTNLDIEQGDVAELAVSVQDAGDNPVFDAEVTAMVIEGNLTMRLKSSPDVVDVNNLLTGRTNANGELVIEVLGESVGDAVVEVTALGDRKTQAYSVNSTAQTFAIVEPGESPVGVSTFPDEELTVSVRNPGGAPVQFSTTFGYWAETENNGRILTRNVGAGNLATATLRAEEAGLANVQVFDTGDPTNSTSDSLEVAISAPSSSAAKISLQANPAVVAPSTGDVVNTTTVTAVVRNNDDQVVGNAPIAFSIDQTTGGGERISPVIVYTDSSGVATTTFSSGSLSSTADGVVVRAEVLSGQNVVDTVNIVIGGTAGSVIIGRGTEIISSEDNTHYILPMSVLVTDSNGNPVPGARVTLGSWPTRYREGFWTPPADCNPVITDVAENEDANRNLTLDPGEDENGNGQLTPPSSAAGAVGPRSPAEEEESGASTFVVETGQNGVAAFQLTYLKASAVWIETEVSASTRVFGSETRSTLTQWLPFLEGEECNLPNSPFNQAAVVGAISLSANPRELLPNGTDQSLIRAFVVDAGGNPAADNTPVTFSLSGVGQLSAPVALTTDGVAEVTYTAGEDVGTVSITASSEDVSSASIDILLQGADLQLTPDRQSLETNGSDEVRLDVQIFDNDGTLLADPTQVVFTVESGPAGLSEPSGLSGTSGKDEVRVVAAGGRAAAFYKPERGTSGTVTISARADGVSASPEDTTISLSSVAVGSIGLDADPDTIGLGEESFSTITAEILGTDLVPVPIGTSVTFTTTKGVFTNGSNQIAAEVPVQSGIVSVRLKRATDSLGVVDNSGGTAVVEASAGNVTSQVNVGFEAPPEEPLIQGIDVRISKENIAANGAETAIVTAEVTPLDGQAADGVNVVFSVSGNGGNFGGQTRVEKVTTSSIATAIFSGGTAGQSDTITVEAQGYTAQVVVNYALGNIVLSILKPDDSKVQTDTIQAGEQVTLSVEVPQGFSADVSFTLDNSALGAVRPNPLTFSSTGSELEATFESANRGGTVQITASAPFLVSDSVSVVIEAPPAFINLAESTAEEPNPDPETLGVRGSQEPSASIITFEVSDATGNPVADGYQIDFEIVNPIGGGEELLVPFALTSGGQVSTTFLSGTKPGQLQVRASYSEDPGVTATGQLTIQGGLPVGENFSLSFGEISEDSVPINAVLGDLFGNPVSDGTGVSFKTYNTGGLISPSSAVTVDGIASTTLFPDPGPISVTAETTGDVTTRVTSIAVIPQDAFSHTIFVGTNGGGVYKSTNSASTWQNISRSPLLSGQNWIQPYVNDLTIDPRDSNTVYAATGFGGRGNIYRSVDGGQNWNSGKRTEIRGLYERDFGIQTLLVDEEDSYGNAPYIWVGTAGFGVQRLRFNDQGKLEQDKVHDVEFSTVNDLVKVDAAGKSGLNSVIYAGTGKGVYRTDDGGETWHETGSGGGSFRGSFVNTLALHPSSNGEGSDVIYAGTRDTGIWISTDSGNNWLSVRGTLEDSENHIKDIFVDEGNNILYILTYFDSLDQPRPSGDVFAHDLDGIGNLVPPRWREANAGLPVFSGDETRFPMWVMAGLSRFTDEPLGDPNKPISLLVGGEGINLFQSTSGLTSGDLVWSESDAGITNLIMAREVYPPEESSEESDVN